MKIAMISPTLNFNGSLDNLIGGAETYAFSLAFAMAKLRQPVTVITASATHNSVTHINDYLEIKSLKTTKSLGLGSHDIISTKIVEAIGSESYDVIHMHQLFSGFNVSSNLMAKLKGIPCFATDHGGGTIFYRAISRFCASLPDAFITVSDYSARYLNNLAPNKRAFVAFGGVDTNRFHPYYNVENLKTSLHLDGYKVILCVGRLLSSKGFDVAVKAMYHLPVNTKLLIVGPVFDLEYYRYLQQIGRGLGDRLQFVGHVSDQDLPKYYNLCDVFVHCSVNDDCFGHHYNFPELLGLVKFEAMACGKPVVVSDVGGLPEQVISGQHGFIVKAGNSVELAESLKAIFADDDLYHGMSKQSLKFVRTNFSWQRIAEKIIEFYNFNASINCR